MRLRDGCAESDGGASVTETVSSKQPGSGRGHAVTLCNVSALGTARQLLSERRLNEDRLVTGNSRFSHIGPTFL